ncbi:MAG: hypothetical protein GMKNLPBB_01334 [Myxococcota bacterium]|nr:hypothetical protein [Myxococcota bacterium]
MGVPGAILLGPQRYEPTLREAEGRIQAEGPCALITAGWQDRENDDKDIRQQLTGEVRNLRLHARSDAAFHEDRELFLAHRAKQDRLRKLQEIYRLRLDHLIDSHQELCRFQAPADLLEPAKDGLVQAIRDLELEHLVRIREIHAEFEDQWKPLERQAVARQIREIEDAVRECPVIVVAGGNVAVLLNRMRLFDIGRWVEGKWIIAWSAGAMAISERLVLFHDNPPQGTGHAELFDAGAGICTGLIPLPHARSRLRLDDKLRVSLLAQRFAPDLCMTLDDGSMLEWRDGRWTSAEHVQVLRRDGRVTPAVER